MNVAGSTPFLHDAPGMGWAPVGKARVVPVSGKPPLEDPRDTTCWRCVNGDLWAEEGRSPPIPAFALHRLFLFLSEQGYEVALVTPTPKELVLISRHRHLDYKIKT